MSSHSQVFVSCHWQQFFGHQLRVWYICFCVNISSGGWLRGITFPPGSWFNNIYIYECFIAKSHLLVFVQSVILCLFQQLTLVYHYHIIVIPRNTTNLIREITRSDKMLNLLEEWTRSSLVYKSLIYSIGRHLLGKLNVVSLVLITWTELCLCLVCMSWPLSWGIEFKTSYSMIYSFWPSWKDSLKYLTTQFHSRNSYSMQNKS